MGRIHNGTHGPNSEQNERDENKRGNHFSDSVKFPVPGTLPDTG
jgi:hypothetical protein